MKTLTFDKAKREKLRKAYLQARKDSKESFTFQGSEFLTDYAKYVLEYLDTGATSVAAW